MIDREKVIKGLECCAGQCNYHGCPYKDPCENANGVKQIMLDALALLKEQEKKQITLHKKHVISYGRNDKFSMRKLYEAICETLLDEGELFIARTDDHEKVDIVFYVAEGQVKWE